MIDNEFYQINEDGSLTKITEFDTLQTFLSSLRPFVDHRPKPVVVSQIFTIPSRTTNRPYSIETMDKLLKEETPKKKRAPRKKKAKWC